MRVTGTDARDAKHFNIRFEEPEVCPLCGHAINPEELFFGTFKARDNRRRLAALYLCRHCYQVFATYHTQSLSGPVQAPSGGNLDLYDLTYIGPKKFAERTFDEHISNLSSSFTKIYNQAKEAEIMGLDEIAGIGYRKSLEFLIKDYLIYLTPEEADKIKRMDLGNCIANKISNEKLKAVASRCAWLGNDMTHYVQRFEDRDIEDMKRFIEAVVYWISMELITEEALSIERRDRK